MIIPHGIERGAGCHSRKYDPQTPIAIQGDRSSSNAHLRRNSLRDLPHFETQRNILRSQTVPVLSFLKNDKKYCLKTIQFRFRRIETVPDSRFPLHPPYPCSPKPLHLHQTESSPSKSRRHSSRRHQTHTPNLFAH